MSSDWILRLRSIFKRRAVEQELDDELTFHFDRLVDRHLASGLTRDEAVRRARLEFGQFDHIKEEHRDARAIGLIDDLGRDLSYAFRQIRRSPGFALLAILCLGLGIGANTSIFGALNAALLRPLAVSDPDRVMMITRGQNATCSYPDFQDFQARTRLLSGLTASFPMESDLEVGGVSEFIAAEVVAANYGSVLGLTPALGQWFTSETEPMAVISHAVWHNRYGGRADVLGRRVGSEAQSYTIVGVAPRDFTGVFTPLRTDIWVPIRTRPGLAAMFQNRVRRIVMVFGRLRPGITPMQASAELNAIDAQLVTEHGAPSEPLPPLVAAPVRGIPNPGSRRLVSSGATLLMMVVSLVLLIACVNVGNLLLVRGSLRQREFAVRRALGATKSRLMAQLLTESSVLAIGGGISGIILALWTNRILERAMPSLRTTFPVQLKLSVDWPVIAFATILSLGTNVACGLFPAWRTSQASSLVNFKGEIGGVIKRRRPLGLLAQVVLSFVLLLIAGSVIDTFRGLQVTDPGFAVTGRLYAYLFFPSAPTPDARRELYAQTLDRLRALPGVRSASQTSTLPLMPFGSDCVSLPSGSQIRATTSAIDPGFFQTMGIRMLAGRDFNGIDLPPGASTVIVTESLARRAWPSSSSSGAGERLTVGCDLPQPMTVVGVVRDSAVRNVGEAPQPHLYLPFGRQFSGGLSAVLVETGTDPAAMVPLVRQTLLGMGENIRVYAVQPMSTYVEQSFAGVRWMAMVLSGFGLLALVLAAIGVYGVITYRVSLRTQEIGVRMALGADRSAIFREVVLQGLAIAAAGVAIGEMLSIPLTRALASAQSGIRATGPATHVSVAVIWITVAFLACAVPAIRASRVDPMEALRHE
jgi:predicted permease